MERRQFTREFKLEAVRLIKDRGVSYVQPSQDLGVHVSQLRDWVKKFAEDPQHAFLSNGRRAVFRRAIDALSGRTHRISLFGTRGRCYEGFVKRSGGFGDRGPVVLVMSRNFGGRTS